MLPDAAEEKVYYRYEGPNSQRHLEESRLNKASRLNPVRRGDRKTEVKEENGTKGEPGKNQPEAQRAQPTWLGYIGDKRSWRKAKLRKWRGLG